MVKIDGITDSSNQIFHMILDDGTVVDLSLRYLGATERWAIDIVHPLLTIYNKILCTHPNILRQYKNKIPFGLMCFTNDGLDPAIISDFKYGRTQLYILNAEDVESVETTMQGLL